MDAVPEGVITSSELASFMKKKGYYWSNDAQVYFHESYNLPVFVDEQARTFYLIEKRKEEKTNKVLKKQAKQLTFLKYFYSELIYGNYLEQDSITELTKKVETSTGFNYEGSTVF